MLLMWTRVLYCTLSSKKNMKEVWISILKWLQIGWFMNLGQYWVWVWQSKTFKPWGEVEFELVYRRIGIYRIGIYKNLRLTRVQVRAISHTSQEPWPWKLWEPKRKCPKAIPNHLQNHVVWPQTLKRSVKVICDWALNQMLFMSSHTIK